MKMSDKEFEQDIYQYVDHIKELLSPKIWENMLLDCSKNEIFILWLLYRNREVNMTQIAEYVHVPLNTATGIISRMEKRKLVSRERSTEDKRIVTICLGECGDKQIQALLKEFIYYGQKFIEAFSDEEMELFFRMMDKVIVIMNEEHTKKTSEKKVRKITIE